MEKERDVFVPDPNHARKEMDEIYEELYNKVDKE